MVAKVAWHPGALPPAPRVGFVVTNLSRSTERVTGFTNQRDKAARSIEVAAIALANKTLIDKPDVA